MPGSTWFNSVGVRNYRSMGQGIQATILTLRTGSHGYGAILSGLAGCLDPMTTARAINASSWCRGCAGGNYVVDFVPIIEAYFPPLSASHLGSEGARMRQMPVGTS